MQTFAILLCIGLACVNPILGLVVGVVIYTIVKLLGL